MPFTIKDINSFVPRANRNVYSQDPEENTVLGNILLLSSSLQALSPKTEDTKKIQRMLDNIVKAANGEIPEKTGDNCIGLMSECFRNITRNNIEPLNVNMRFRPEEDRLKIKDLIGHVAAGLGVSGMFEITEDQMEKAEAMREKGKLAVAEERGPEAEREEVPEKPVNALRALDELKAEAGKLPKTAGDPQRETGLRGQAEELCRKIMTARRASDAQRNRKDLLEKAVVDPFQRKTWERKLKESDAFSRFLKDTSYSELAALAAKGHGGALEEKFKEYVKNLDSIPEDTPAEYMPTARERAEALKKRMEGDGFRNASPETKAAAYAELLACRSVVNSVRGDKSTLAPTLDAHELKEEVAKYGKDPLKTIFQRAISREGGTKALNAARQYGHGGKLEETLMEEVREVSRSSESWFSLPDVPSRFQPTYKERMKDIQDLLISGRLNEVQKIKVIMEYKLLAQRQLKDPKGRIADANELNSLAVNYTKLYAKMGDRTVLRKLEKACLQGSSKLDRVIDEIDRDHKGQIRAAQLLVELDESMKKNPQKAALEGIAAQVMSIATSMYTFHKTGSQEILLRSLQGNSVGLSAARMLEDETFQAMCAGMTEEELAKTIKAGGVALTQKYNEVKDALKKEAQQGPEKAPGTVVTTGPKKETTILPTT